MKKIFIYSFFLLKKLKFNRSYAIDKDSFSDPLSKVSLIKLANKIDSGSSLNYQDSDDLESIYKSIKYITNGNKSFSKINDNQISLIISNAVFEHIFRKDINFFFKNIERILSKGGIFLLRIDFKDHLVGDFFNHILPITIWESKIFTRGSHYTNRFSIDEFLKIIQNNNLKIILNENQQYICRSFFNLDNTISIKSIFKGVNKPSSVLIAGIKQ